MKTYPLEGIIGEPEAEDTINRLGLTREEVNQAADGVVSVSVSAKKQ